MLLEAWKSKIKMLADSLADEVFFLACRQPSSGCIRTWWRG